MNQYIELKEEEGYRIQDPIDIVEVKLLEGTAEVFGQELIIEQLYEFQPHSPFSIFTWKFAKLIIKYQSSIDIPGYIVNEEDTTYSNMMHQILKINYLLEYQRSQSLKQTNSVGPRVLIVGSKSSGKNTLCKILLNYSSVYGWNPIFADLDPDLQSSGWPGSIKAEVYSANRSDKNLPVLSYYYGYIYQEQIKDNCYKSLYYNLVEQLGLQITSKFQSDFKQNQDYKRQFLAQYRSIKDTDLSEQLYNKHQEDKDQKEIYASGLFVNCPTLIGSHSQVVEYIKNIIEIYQITFVIVIDLPDVFRELDRQGSQVLLYKLEKLRGIVNQNVYDIENLWKKKLKQMFTCGHKLLENQFYLYELQQRDDRQIVYQRSKSKKIVRLIIGVLHLKKQIIENIEEDKNISEAQKEQQITDYILQAPLAFLAYIDDYHQGAFQIQIPNNNCYELLQSNVCVFGKMNM